ncbi:MAG: hypothetical protein ABGW82_10700, partial [Paracoccus sp. (in: a-proteobacteria)]
MNSETRLSARPLGADAASEADGVGGEGRDLPQSRGFFGRFFDALTGSEEDEAGDEGDRPVAQPAPGMGRGARESAWDDLYALNESDFGISKLETDRTYRVLADYVFAK